MLVHSVYFWLKPDLTTAQRAEFQRGVESLRKIKAIKKIYVGVPARTEKRPVIESSYSVSLTVIVKDVAPGPGLTFLPRTSRRSPAGRTGSGPG